MNINEEMKLHKWAQDMADQKSSGLSQIKWCKMKGIPATTFVNGKSHVTRTKIGPPGQPMLLSEISAIVR